MIEDRTPIELALVVAAARVAERRAQLAALAAQGMGPPALPRRRRRQQPWIELVTLPGDTK